MGWIEITNSMNHRERRNRAAAPPRRKMKLYADEDVEESVIEYLRERGVNIVTARDLGHVPRSDDFHAAFAKKKKRFLLTKNGRHYLPDSKLPFHRCYGVIAIEGSNADTGDYGTALWCLIEWIIPEEEMLLGCKIEVNANVAKIHYLDEAGRRHIDTIKFDGGRVLRWEDEHEAA